jgi:heme O synthase-like polyprenyltransferase
MALSNTLNARPNAPSWRDYLTLTKPRVVAVMVLDLDGGDVACAPCVAEH